MLLYYLVKKFCFFKNGREFRDKFLICLYIDLVLSRYDKIEMKFVEEGGMFK